MSVFFSGVRGPGDSPYTQAKGVNAAKKGLVVWAAT